MVCCVLVAPFVLKYVVTAEQYNKTAVECECVEVYPKLPAVLTTVIYSDKRGL